MSFNLFKRNASAHEHSPLAQQNAIPAQSMSARKKAARAAARQHAKQLKQLSQKAEQKNKEKKRQLKSSAAPKNSVDFIGYERMYDDGLCAITSELYSKTIQFSDINYQTARLQEQSDLFAKWCETLAYCDSSMHLQINIINRRIDQEGFRESMLLPLEGDANDQYRTEINDMLMDKALEGQNNIIREKYATFSTKAESFEEAKRNLARIEGDMTAQYKALGCQVNSLTGAQRLQLIHNVFRPNDRFTFKYDDLIWSGLTTKSFVAPGYLDFRPNDYYEFDGNYGEVLYVRSLPRVMGDQLIKELSDLPIPLNIAIHIDAVEQSEALEYTRRQIAYMEMEVTSKQDKAIQANRNPDIAIPMETRKKYVGATELRDLLENKNQNMFKVSILVYTFAADLKEIFDNVAQIVSAARKKDVLLAPLHAEQRQGVNSILPLGHNLVDKKRTLTTASTAIFVPFTTQELYEAGGIYYRQNTMSHNLVFFNRYNLQAPNGLLFGTPGSGKSFFAKDEIFWVLLKDKNAEVIIIDPEREYTRLATALNGEVVYISAGSPHHLNPFDISDNYADDADPLSLKSEFILTICELLIGGVNGLSGEQRSIISRCTKTVYAKYFSNPKKYPVPTMRDFYNEILKQPEAAAANLALQLELYIEGALDVFAHPTNVDTSNRFVVYDVRDLGKQMRTFGMMVVLDQIWNRITSNREKGKRTWLYIDEMQLLLTNKFSSDFFFELWSRARKWGAVPTGITQNVRTLLDSSNGQRMLSNSDFIAMMNQHTNDRLDLAHLLNMSDRQSEYITNAESGAGLLFAGNCIIPIINKFPKDTEMYKIMTTKIEEITPKAPDV